MPASLGRSSLGAIACALMAFAGCDIGWESRPLPDDPYGWHGRGKTVVLADIGNSADLRHGFAEATRGDVYFGAIHVDRASARYAYARNWNSIDAAISVSAAVCAGSAGRRCVLAAVVLPESMAPGTRTARGFSVQTLHQFRLRYGDVQQPGLWGAYAISPMASQGFSASEPSQDAARRAALQNCRARIGDELARLGPVGASAARRGGFDRCDVVHITQP